MRLGDELPARLSPSAPSKAHDQGRFFVTDAVMAATTLDAAWHREHEVQCSYERMKANNGAISLNSLLADFIKQTSNQASILQEAKTEALLLGQWRRDQGILKRIS